MTNQEAKEWRPTKRYTNDEKIATFDRLRDMARDYVEATQGDDCYDDSDDRQLIWEAVIDILGGDVWRVINALR